LETQDDKGKLNNPVLAIHGGDAQSRIMIVLFMLLEPCVCFSAEEKSRCWAFIQRYAPEMGDARRPTPGMDAAGRNMRCAITTTL